MGLTIQKIILRLLLALVFSTIIGIDRKWKNRPAGVRTHALVCMGAAVVALIQCQIEAEAIQVALANPELAGIIRSDPARLTCQVISGIGFLGAGTIIVTKRSVAGLTTAASLWASACMGIAIGLGYYYVAGAAFVFIMLVLIVMKKILRLHICKCLEIQYTSPKQTKGYLIDFFAERNMKIKIADDDVNYSNKEYICTNHIMIELSPKTDLLELLEELTANPSILKIKTANLN